MGACRKATLTQADCLVGQHALGINEVLGFSGGKGGRKEETGKGEREEEMPTSPLNTVVCILTQPPGDAFRAEKPWSSLQTVLRKKEKDQRC